MKSCAKQKHDIKLRNTRLNFCAAQLVNNETIEHFKINKSLLL